MDKPYLFSFILISSLLISFNSANSDTFCVDSATTLQSRLDDAAANSKDDKILIVQGTYNGNFEYDTYNSGNITIEGGYVKAGILCFLPHFPSPSKTVLDGGNVNTTLDVYSPGYDITIKRLTVRNGKNLEYSSSTGGIVATSSGNGRGGRVEISHTIVEKNQGRRGGGISASSAYPNEWGNAIIITNNTIKNNTASTLGGGIFAVSHADVGTSALIQIENNTIFNNQANEGGGIYIRSEGEGGTGAIQIANNYIYENDAVSGGEGGGIYLESTTDSTDAGIINFSNNFIYANNALGGGLSGRGGGVYIGFEGIHPYGNSNFIHNTITENTASNSGGGIYHQVSTLGQTKTLTLLNNIVWGNSAGSYLATIRYTSANTDAIAHNNDLGDNNYSTGNPFSNWKQASNNINANPLFIGNGDYHLQVDSPCREKGTTNYPLPLTDIDGDERILFGLPDLGADEIIQEYFPWILVLPSIMSGEK